MSADAVELLERLLAGTDLSEAEAAWIMRSMAADELAPALSGALLIALRCKGEAASEIRGFAQAMRELARSPEIPPGDNYVDIVGTGGDSSGSLNLSTGSALLAAACGAKVVKHGNRSITSKSGSADALEALGLPVPLDEKEAGQSLEALGFTFLFAPRYHPAMKNIGPVRAALRVRTVFNILGPLANPAAPPFNVIGAFSEEMAEIMAQTLSGMDAERSFVIHGAPGWDEATPVGPFLCFDVRPGMVQRSVRDPADLGLARCSADDLLGGEADENAERLMAALGGEDTQAHRDALTLGAALALEVTGEEPDAEQAVSRAREALAGGSAKEFLQRLRQFGEELRG
ncbi:MAG: anthranilate phosphoribosyltransferase [Candidatus Rariloculaceae bacterium]